MRYHELLEGDELEEWGSTIPYSIDKMPKAKHRREHVKNLDTYKEALPDIAFDDGTNPEDTPQDFVPSD